MFFRMLCLSLFICASSDAYAGKSVIRIDDEKHVIFPACAQEGTCDIKQIVFWSERYRVGPADEHDIYEQSYGSALYAWYETNSLATLEDYVFVQYIHGCVFQSHFTQNGREVLYGMVRNHLDPHHSTPFVHPDWTFDSNDKDPAYNTNITHADERHFFMQWNDKVEEFPEKQGNLYGEVRPTLPRLFTKDLPTQAMAFAYQDGSVWAINTSLEFRMCLYREKDVPKEATTDTRISAPPIACFDWNESYIYDHEAKRFDTPKGVVAECVAPTIDTHVARGESPN